MTTTLYSTCSSLLAPLSFYLYYRATIVLPFINFEKCGRKSRESSGPTTIIGNYNGLSPHDPCCPKRVHVSSKQQRRRRRRRQDHSQNLRGRMSMSDTRETSNSNTCSSIPGSNNNDNYFQQGPFLRATSIRHGFAIPPPN